MPIQRTAATLLAAGLLAGTAVTGIAATASASTPSRATTPSAAPTTALAACAYYSNFGYYCGYDVNNTYADYGDRGNKVKEIQAILQYRGYNIGRHGVDGSFGGDTLKAVKTFQRNWNLDDDGKVGPKTWARLRG
ncbi:MULTISPECIES: peptidoglycan-binding domain-containing protein [unclassified Streptomyces]|nr:MULTISPECIES: peptidoglycan-binding domain-containing protein [unclassified Streptomyces]MYY85980.1 peptidoglycan-binding protein [Streptomyces sp. SID335]MYZ18081.1 peptidoglycan-binding protein [Streptomyces sp. SID337]NEA03919.1 peptidoglycan-binding protein [Streptomyces sp. SID10116]NEB45084.1 peptidoglycan-binding protein [Streptomyces sp. SID339]